MKTKLIFITAFFNYCFCTVSSAQIYVLSTFNPPAIGSLCGIGYDSDSVWVWLYECNSDTIRCYNSIGGLLKSFAVPGGPTNNADIQINLGQIMFNGNLIYQPLLFTNGESGSAEIYAMDKNTGIIIDTLHTTFGNDHVVGGCFYSPWPQSTFFMVQNNMAGPTLVNTIAETDANGNTLQSYSIGNYFDVGYGDIETINGDHLYMVSSLEDSIAEFNPLGVLTNKHALPQGVTGLSGIASYCNVMEAWVSSVSGDVYHLGLVPCHSTGTEEVSAQSFYSGEVTPNPFNSQFSFSIMMKQQGKLKIVIINMLGEEIKIIYDGVSEAGKKDFSITDRSLSKGVYILKAESTAATIARRVICIK